MQRLDLFLLEKAEVLVYGILPPIGRGKASLFHAIRNGGACSGSHYLFNSHRRRERIGQSRSVRMVDKDSKRQRPVLPVNRGDQFIGQVRQILVPPSIFHPPNLDLGQRHVDSPVGARHRHDDGVGHRPEPGNRPRGAGGGQEIRIAINSLVSLRSEQGGFAFRGTLLQRPDSSTLLAVRPGP